jgi:myo-inositol-1-phosphate synthase
MSDIFSLAFWIRPLQVVRVDLHASIIRFFESLTDQILGAVTIRDFGFLGDVKQFCLHKVVSDEWALVPGYVVDLIGIVELFDDPQLFQQKQVFL